MRTKKLLKLRKARERETIRRVTNKVNGRKPYAVNNNCCVLCKLYHVPHSFLAGWADYAADRVVDMDRTLKVEPPLSATCKMTQGSAIKVTVIPFKKETKEEISRILES